MIIARLSRDKSASSAAEFALVLPLLMVFLFGIIDAGRWMWTYNQAEKAAQMGARMAIVTDMISPGIGSSYVGVGGLTQGDVIPASQFGKVTCTSLGCTCTTSPCPSLGTANTTAFNTVVTRMKFFLPSLTAANVTIEYSSSGLGYAGSPVLPDLSPLVTVKIGPPATALQFRPLTTFTIASMNMPSFTTTLSAEDLSGAVSN